ncbi:MAG TPA: hypothetical protein VGD02_05425 [Gemmatimonadaceae bacterium]|jgi:tetratricopeptide (TPR) repeat protein
MLTRTLALGCAALLAIAGSTQGQAPRLNPPSGKLEVSSASDQAKSEFWLGFDDWQNFTYSAAQKHFERAASLDPNFGLARAFAAAAPAINGAPVANAELDRGIADAARASTAEGLLALAWREKAFGRNAAASSLFRAAMDLMPNEPRIASEYVWSLAATDMKAAAEAGKAARSKFQTAGVISPALAYVFTQVGDSAAGLAEAQRYTQLSPTQPVSFVTYGDYLQQLSRYDDAETQYRRSLAFAPKHGDGTSDGVVALASLLARRGKAAEARQVVADAFQRAPSIQDSLAYLNILGGASLYASDIPAAMSAFETASRLSGRTSKGMATFGPNIALALTNAAFGDRKSVSRYLSPIRAIEPGDSLAMAWAKADVYAYAGQSDSTFKYADMMVRSSPTDANVARAAHFMRGQVYLTNRQCAKALGEFRQSDSTLIEVQSGSADCEMQAGNRAAALRYRDLALRHDVNFYDAGEIRARMRMSQLR